MAERAAQIKDGVRSNDSLKITITDNSEPEDTGSEVLDKVVDSVRQATREQTREA